jgi:hypothetical protein
LVVDCPTPRHEHEHKRHLLHVSVLLDEGVDGEELVEGLLPDLEGPVHKPPPGALQHLQLVSGGEHEVTRLLHTNVTDDEVGTPEVHLVDLEYTYRSCVIYTYIC